MHVRHHIRVPAAAALLLVLGVVVPGAARASATTDAPAAVVFNGGASNIVFFTGSDGGIEESVELDGQWSDPAEISGTAGTATSGPAADVFRGGAEIDVYYRSTAGGIDGPVAADDHDGAGAAWPVRADPRITWTFTRPGRPVTLIRRVRVLRFERGARIAVHCAGKHCRFKVHRADRARLRSLWRRLERVRFRAGQRLPITISHPHRTSIRVLVRFRRRRAPVERQLRTRRRHHAHHRGHRGHRTHR